MTEKKAKKTAKTFYTDAKEYFLAHRKLRIGVYIGLAIIIIGMILVLSGLRIRFIIDNELQLMTEPEALAIDAMNTQTITVPITLSVNKFSQCNTVCTVSLADTYDDTTTNITTLTFNSDDPQAIDINISPTQKGTDIRAYIVEASCHNIKSTLCFTDQQERFASSIILVNTSLSQNEQQFFARRQQMQELLDVLQNATTVSLQNEYLAQLLPVYSTETAQLLSDQNKINISLEKNITQARAFEQAWNRQDYEQATEYELLLSHITNLSAQALLTQEKIIGLLDLRNANIEGLRILANSTSSLQEKFRYFKEHATQEHQSRAIQIGEIIERTAYLIDLLSHTQTINERDYATSIMQARSSVDQVNNHYNNIQDTLTFHTTVLVRALELQNPSYVNIVGQPNDACELLQAALINTQNVNAANFAARNNYINQSGQIAVADLNQASQYLLSRAALDQLTSNIAYANTTLIESLVRNLNTTTTPPSQTGMRIAEIKTTQAQNTYNNLCVDDATQRNIPDVQNDITLITTSIGSIRPITYSIPVIITEEYRLEEVQTLCCSYGSCRTCQQTKTPILFLHGHAFNDANSPEDSMLSFAKTQHRLLQDGFINGGLFTIYDENSTEAYAKVGMLPSTTTFRSSYYYIKHYDISGYSLAVQQSERIENYALRLQEIVQDVKEKTGSQKVILVAHSMGGLVAREYISLFGTNSIAGIMTINTPHKGVEGKVKSGCGVLGAAKECEDLARDSIFLNRLNNRPLPAIPLAVIASTGCAMDNNKKGDGIVTVDNARWGNLPMIVINGTCTDALGTSLHSAVLDPEVYPQVYGIVSELLQNWTS